MGGIYQPKGICDECGHDGKHHSIPYGGSLDEHPSTTHWGCTHKHCRCMSWSPKGLREAIRKDAIRRKDRGLNVRALCKEILKPRKPL